MNWGKKIALAYLSFVALMVFMVYMCMQQKDIFLVTDDYYQAEIAYENVITKKNNVAQLEGNIEINYADKGITIQFPEACLGGKGTATFYRPSSKNLDVSHELNIVSPIVFLPTSEMKGNYLLKLDWDKEDEGYYLEQQLTL